MRWLLRSLLLCPITLPLFYFYGLPKLMDKAQDKMQEQSYTQCQDQLRENNMTGSPASLLKDVDANEYCRCVAAGLTLTKADLFTLMRHQEPVRLQESMKPVVAACNQALETRMNQITDAGPAPTVTQDEKGVETVYFK